MCFKTNYRDLGLAQRKVNVLKNLKDPEKTNLRNIITFMIESCVLDISFHPIANYQQYYNKKL